MVYNVLKVKNQSFLGVFFFEKKSYFNCNDIVMYVDINLYLRLKSWVNKISKEIIYLSL